MNRYDHLCAQRNMRKKFHEMSCLQQCQDALNNYYAIITGKGGQRIRYGERWLDRHDADAKLLADLYQTLRANCPEAQATLPDLSEGARTVRGCGRASMMCR